MKVDILAHLYHTDMWDELSNDILNSGLDYRLFVNMPHSGPGYDALERKIKDTHRNATVMSTENKGRDIGGTLRLLDFWLKQDKRSEVVYFWHSKLDHGWRREMVVSSLNNRVADMFLHPKVGLVGAAKWHLTWYSPGSFDYDNTTMEMLCSKFGISKPFFGFIGGTVFMARSSIYEEAFKDRSPKEFADELDVPMSVLYAFERFFGVLASQKHLIIGMEPSGEPFDEWYYLDTNPDVRNAVQTGQFMNGFAHFLRNGRSEGRKPYEPETLYDKVPAAIVHRRKAVGDVIFSEPIVRAIKRQRYDRVHLHTDYPEVFRPHPDVSTAPIPIWGDYFELDGVYEKDRNKLVQDAFLDAFSLKLSPEEKLPRIILTDDEKRWAQDTLGAGKWVVIDAGYFEGRLDRFTKTCDWERIVEHVKTKNFKTLVVGARANSDGFAFRAPEIRNIDLNLRGSTNLRQVFALIAQAYAIIGLDSGQISIAQAVGTPGIGLYEEAVLPKYRLAWGSLITPIVVRDSVNTNAILRLFEQVINPSLKREEIEMTTRKGFEFTINELIKRYNVQEIIETGTFRGNGSTKVFAQTGLPVTSIECNSGFYQEACRNLAGYHNVKLLYGYSLSLGEMLEFVKEDNFDGTKPEIIKDVPANDARNFYLTEINHGSLEENLLEKNFKKNVMQLIFLDSAGGVGWLEFKKVLELMQGPILLVIDDANHVKHYRTVVRLRQLGLDVNVSEDGSWAWCHIEEKPI